MSEEKKDNWRQFQGTELGGLMSQIYGNERPQINYPKPKMKPSKPAGPFIPGGANPDASDPRKSTKRSVSIDVPKPSSKSTGRSYAMIDCIPRRKNENAIKSEIEEIKMKQMHYRPAYVKPISTESEKDRLSQVNEYKGGKCLPAEITLPAREAPFELLERQKEKDRLDKLRNKSNINPPRIKAPISVREELAEQISAEIEERRSHLEEMLKLGISPADEMRIRNEIKDRIKELQKIDG